MYSILNKHRSPGGRYFPYAKWIEDVRSFHWEQTIDSRLTSELQACRCSSGEQPKLFSILAEAVRRTTGFALHDSQLAASYAMARGKIAELATGEGKTLAAAVTAASLALRGTPVHLLGFNDYLTRRDYEANRRFFEFCGLTPYYITASTSRALRRERYRGNILYLSAREAALDYLRDFSCLNDAERVFPGFSAALADEADSLLIDEAGMPLILAGETRDHLGPESRFRDAAAALEPEDYHLDQESRQVWLTDRGLCRMEQALEIENLYASENTAFLPLMSAALEARFLCLKDRDYLIRDGKIVLIDSSTGRAVPDRRFPDMLHRAVVLKEGLQPEPSAVVCDSMSIQAFFLRYPFRCGMTGTAVCAEEEFRQMYGMDVAVIPPHRPCLRIDHENRIFPSQEEQRGAILDQVHSLYQKGQPVLIGTGSVEESEALSRLLKKSGLPHCVLNARNDSREAEVIARAGEAHRITVSTNISGRGVDIRLGGVDGASSAQVRKAGGLFVLGTHLNRSERIDLQLRGRAGRQGDPGESQFFLALDQVDPSGSFPVKESESISPKRLNRLIRRIQRSWNGRDAQARLMLERYSAVTERQRDRVAQYREQIFSGERPPESLKEHIPDQWKQLIQEHGHPAVKQAEQYCLLYALRRNWSCYLSALEDMRRGIHLVLIGGKNPFDEYYRFACSAFEEMQRDTLCDAARLLCRYRITQGGVAPEEELFSSGAATWTYAMDDSAGQFSRIPQLASSLSNQIRGTVFTVRGAWKKLRSHCR